jgi:acyl-CoA reductase-like NAD-dependent aldehyde dehydrogenase
LTVFILNHSRPVGIDHSLYELGEILANHSRGSQGVNVINDGRVQAASLTGSVRAGSAVASEARKSVLELGGADAFIVLEDADLPKSVAAGIKGRLQQRR